MRVFKIISLLVLFTGCSEIVECPDDVSQKDICACVRKEIGSSIKHFRIKHLDSFAGINKAEFSAEGFDSALVYMRGCELITMGTGITDEDRVELNIPKELW